MARIQLERLPENDSELYELVKVLWGVVIPREKVCPDHVAPFDVFADAYFRRGSSISLWHGSRGLSGKSFMLSILGLTIAFLRGSDVNILGGSLAQSTNVHEHMRNAMDSENSPRYMIETEAYTQIKLTNRARIRPLTASQKTVRGPHPATLLCLATGSLVDTPAGFVEIQDLCEGQVVYGSSDMAVETQCIVTRKTCSGYQNTLLVETDHAQISCTYDHKFWTQRGWVEAQDLTEEDMLSVRESSLRPVQKYDRSMWGVLQEEQDDETEELLAVRRGYTREGRQEIRYVQGVLADREEQEQSQVSLRGVRSRTSDVQRISLQGLLQQGESSKSKSLSGLRGTTKISRNKTLSSLPLEVDEQRCGCGEICRSESNWESRNSHFQGRRTSSGTSGLAKDQVQQVSSSWQMGSGLCSQGLEDSNRSTRSLLARSSREHAERQEEESVTRGQGVHSSILEDRPDAFLVQGRVKSVSKGLTLETWDITTTTGNFFADGVLVHNCDEIDEMDEDILNAALGQPMPQTNYLGEIIKPYTILCSTWQNSDSTFEHKYREFQEKGLPIKTWCVAQDSLVTTSRGKVPIQEVTDSDFVLTRNGFRHVQHVTFMGYKPAIGLNIGDKTLWATGNHRIAIDGGWRHVSALATDTMAPSRANPSVLLCELVPFSTLSSASLIPPSTGLIDGLSNDIQMLNIDTGSISTEMINSEVIVNRTNDAKPDPSVRLNSGMGTDTLEILDSVTVSLTSRPIDTVSGEHGIILPVWDIGVEGNDHEFVANDVLVHNCYRESANPIDGWLTQETIDQKKLEIPAEMWRVEYELGEPSIGNRAFDTDAVENMFSLPMEPLQKQEKQRFEEYTFEEPVGDGIYIAAADWAKEQDFTVISVIRLDLQPHTLVYYMRVNRRPYPAMIKWFNDAIERYNAEAIHDATGLGNVVNDYIDVRARKFIMTGEKRSNMLTEFVGAVERGYFKFPKIPSAFSALKYCRTGDLYSGATKDYHLPDEVCSFALAWNAGKKFSGYGEPVTVKRDGAPGKYEKHFMIPGVGMENNGIISPSYIEGVVVNKSEGEDDMSFSLTV